MAISTKVLDSWAVIAFFENEPSAKKVEKILIESIETNTRLAMTTVNLGEVWYSIARAHSREDADASVDRVRSLGVWIVPADWNLTYLAAKLKARGGISYADCFAAALASIEDSDLVTGDQELKQFEGEIRIEWV
jgi:ribonuclease VapC